jgi:hypothetical protein
LAKLPVGNTAPAPRYQPVNDSGGDVEYEQYDYAAPR